MLLNHLLSFKNIFVLLEDTIYLLGGWDITLTYLSDVLAYSVNPTTGALTLNTSLRCNTLSTF